MSDKAKSVLKGAAMAAAGAVLAYAGEWVSGGELGQWGPMVAALLAIATNAVRKYSTE